MTRVFSLMLCLAVVLAFSLYTPPVLAADGVGTVIEKQEPAWDFWALGRYGQFTARAGHVQGRTELGIEGSYLDSLEPDDIHAYAAGLYGLYVVNPNAAFPIRGWLPLEWDWLPETVPVEFYVGGKMDFEFANHKLMPAIVIGAKIATGTNLSIGAEYQRAFTDAVSKEFVPTDTDKVFLTLTWAIP